MTANWWKFQALSGTEKRVFLSVVMLLPLFWVGLRVFGFARLQAWLERAPLVQKTRPAVDELAAFGRLVNTAAIAPPAP